MFKIKQFKRALSLTLVALLLIYVLPFNTNPSFAAGSNSASFSDIRYLVNGVALSGSDLNTINNGTPVTIEFNIAIDNSATTTPAALTYDFPAEDYLDFSGANLSGALENGDGDVYGNWYVDETSKQLIVIFNDLAASESNAQGKIVITRSFYLENVDETVVYTIDAPIAGNSSKSYQFSFAPPDEGALTKSGEQNSANSLLLDWTIDINSDAQKINNPVLDDYYDSALLNAVAGSVKIYEITVTSGAAVSVDANVTSQFNGSNGMAISNSDGRLNITFGNSIDRAYRVLYQTKIDTSNSDNLQPQVSYSNNASFTNQSAQATVTVTNENKHTKSGQADNAFNADAINWTIELNTLSQTLQNLVVVDTIPSGLNLDLSSIAVADNSGNPLTIDYTVTSSSALEIVFNEPVTSAIELHYQTTIDKSDGSVYQNASTADGGKNYATISYTNDAIISYDGNSGTTISDTVDVAKGVPLNKNSEKISIDGKSYLKWQLDINTDFIDLGTVVVEDFMSDNLTLDVDSIVVYPLTAQANKVGVFTQGAALDSSEYSVVYDTAGGATGVHPYYTASAPLTPAHYFDVRFVNPVSNAYRITYLTEVDIESKENYDNSAEIWYKPNGTGTGSGSGGSGGGSGDNNWNGHTINYSQAPTENTTLSKYHVRYKDDNLVGYENLGKHSVDHRDNTFGWLLSVSPQDDGLTNIVITDNLDEGHYMTTAQINAIRVAFGKPYPSATALVLGTDYTVTTATDNNGKINSFTIDFRDDFEASFANLYVAYESTINEDTVFNNTGELLTYTNGFTVDATELSTPLTKTITPVINDVTKYNGQKQVLSHDSDSTTITWAVDVNYLGKNIVHNDNIILSDTIEDTQKLIADSVQIYSDYSYDKNGAIVDEASLTSIDLTAEDIKVVYGADLQSFEVIFPTTITKPYRVVYQTQRVGLTQPTYNNTATVNYGAEYTASVDYDNYDNFVYKNLTTGSLPDGNNSTYADWTVLINESVSVIDSLTLTDTLSSGLTLDMNSFTLKTATGDALDFYAYFNVAGPKTTSTNENIYTYTLRQGAAPINQKLYIGYRTTIDKTMVYDGEIYNNISFDGTSSREESVSKSSEKTVAYWTTYGIFSSEAGSFTVTKKDKDSKQTLAGVKYELFRYINDEYRSMGYFTTDQNGQIHIERLKYLDYQLIEISTIEGYSLDSTPYDFAIASTADVTFTLTNAKETSIESTSSVSNSSKSTSGVSNSSENTSSDSSRNKASTTTTEATTTPIVGQSSTQNTTSNTETSSRQEVDTSTQDNSETTTSTEQTTTEETTQTESTTRRQTTKDKQADTTTTELATTTAETTTSISDSDAASSTAAEQTSATTTTTQATTANTSTQQISRNTNTNTPVVDAIELEDDQIPLAGNLPENGTLVIDGSGQWTYTPDEGFEGHDSFTIIVVNPDGSEEKITIELDIELPFSATTLPKTNEGIPYHYPLIGILLIALGFIFRSDRIAAE